MHRDSCHRGRIAFRAEGDIQHHFRTACGCAPFGSSTEPRGVATAAVHVRFVLDLDCSQLKIEAMDGRGFE